MSRHACLNDVLRHSLVIAGVPAQLDPNELACGDGKRQDGMSLLPWKISRPLVWNFTLCHHIFLAQQAVPALLLHPRKPSNGVNMTIILGIIYLRRLRLKLTRRLP